MRKKESVTTVRAAPPDRTPVRVQFEVQKHRLEEIDQLKEELDLASRKDLFSFAITLLIMVVRELRQGREIGSFEMDTQSYRPFVLPFYVADTDRNEGRLSLKEGSQPEQPTMHEEEEQEPERQAHAH